MPTPSVDLIDPTDKRWASALERGAHDVYATPAYVTAEALRLQAEPVGCLVDEGGRPFLLQLLLRRLCGAEGSTKDAISPYGYPGIVLNEDGAAPEDSRTSASRPASTRSAMRTCAPRSSDCIRC